MSDFKFDLNTAIKALVDDTPELSEQIQKDDEALRASRQEIIQASRQNFILERELAEIDEKIKLLVKNRITVQEIVSGSSGLQSDHKDDNNQQDQSSFKAKRSLYEDLFYLLQSEPKYCAKLAKLLSASEIPSFVQTVVFDMYGDQYDTREERLLLALFKISLEEELQCANDKGSLLRANTAVTQMLSAYARRGHGLSILKDILEAPIKAVASDKELNLEIQPRQVYLDLIIEHEMKTGKPSPWDKNVDDEKAAENKEVQEVSKQRCAKLLEIADDIFKRIVAAADSIPYGMRWICKTLGEISRKRFPDIEKAQVASLMGGYINLRFFNPVIVTPDTVGLISQKPSKITRRNLILVAKVLQNLSNGVFFGDKEIYMKQCNSFIEARFAPLQEYFDKLCAIDDLDEFSQVDKLTEGASSHSNIIQVSINQIFLMHHLLIKHLAVIAPDETDPLRDLLKRLGAAPEQVKIEENRTIHLQLSEAIKRKAPLAMSSSETTSVTKTSTSVDVHPLVAQAKTLLVDILKKLPSQTTATDLLAFLEEERRKAIEQNEMSFADQVSNIVSMLSTLTKMKLLPQGSTDAESYNMFLWSCAKVGLDKRAMLRHNDRRRGLIEKALKSVLNHRQYLQSRLELYKIYLDNVRQGQAQLVQASSKNSKPAKPQPAKVVKLSHTQLEEMGIITAVSNDVPKKYLKSIHYEFRQGSPGKFTIEPHLKKLLEVKLLNKPIELDLEDLLAAQEEGRINMELDDITVNVNLLIRLLNKEFLS